MIYLHYIKQIFSEKGREWCDAW